MESNPTVLIKIGGRAATDRNCLLLLLEELAGLRDRYRFVLVHGGGAEVSKVTKVFGLEPVFKDGVRMTSPEEMDIVDMVLAGKMNKYLVRNAGRYFPAVGVSGSDGKLFTGRRLSCGEDEVTCTGQVDRVNPQLAEALLQNGFVPIVSSVSMDHEGNPLNINADEAALALAAELKSRHLIFLSDVPGILKEDRVIPNMTKSDVENEIAAGVIAGGMIPKVRSSVAALEQGVRDIIIGSYTEAGDLEAMLGSTKGSRIELT